MAEPPDPGPGGPDPSAGHRVDLLVRDFDLGTLVAVRHEVEQCSERHGLSGLALYRFIVAVNEITTNAVRHGGGTGRLRLWRTDGRICCEVTDRGPGMPASSADHRPVPPESSGGRGLWLARHGVRRFTVRTGTGGTSVTLEAI
ncbi:hypothetical protein GCM10010156_57440 [Planobispora rosea]|uniref:Histidine kinase/HSP90-like ATPase domain-containing protein n=1 Tax=Planobispora rosea TaxID=35762 RepID=A0A8J3WFQ5_PLARO|nr:ATP-binding protein [Planobispora rosea]GGS91670.1 hypothetical protein GCM10010156_57440 [Planobispora rosea]GIH87047.1 hypothetical protein Pro02_54550 [Planobispora rosea]